MITRKDANKEMVNARKVLADEKATVAEKLKAVGKVAEVTLKVALDNRTNLVRIMEAKGVAKVEPRKRDNAKPTEEKTEE